MKIRLEFSPLALRRIKLLATEDRIPEATLIARLAYLEDSRRHVMPSVKNFGQRNQAGITVRVRCDRPLCREKRKRDGY